MSTSKPIPFPAEVAAEGVGEDVAQLRSLLLGRDFLSHLEAIESAANGAAVKLRMTESQIRSEIKRVEADLVARIEGLGRRIDAEQEARQAVIEALDERVSSGVKAADRQLIAQERSHADAVESLRQDVQAHLNAMETSLDGRFESLRATLEAELKALQATKADRRAVADLLTGLATRLSDQA